MRTIKMMQTSDYMSWGGYKVDDIINVEATFNSKKNVFTFWTSTGFTVLDYKNYKKLSTLNKQAAKYGLAFEI